MSAPRATEIDPFADKRPTIRARIADPKPLATGRRAPQPPTICKVVDQSVDLVEQDKPLRQTLSHRISTVPNVANRLTSNARRAARDLNQTGRA